MANKENLSNLNNCVEEKQSSPIYTGKTVLGIAFDKGVIIASDDYFSLDLSDQSCNLQRVSTVNQKCALGCSGNYDDFQAMLKRIQERVADEKKYENGQETMPDCLHDWIAKIQYDRETEQKPLMLRWIVGGMDSNGKFALILIFLTLILISILSSSLSKKKVNHS